MSWNRIAPRSAALLGHRSTPRWLPPVVAAVAVASLLLAYFTVVRQLTRSGESRRVAVAAHSDAVWRCYALRGPGQRQTCLQGLDSPTGDLAQVNVLVAIP